MKVQKQSVLQRFFRTFSAFTLIFLLLLGASVEGVGQTIIVSDGLNNSSSLFTLSGGTYYTGNSGAGDRPANSPFAIEGSNSRGVTNATATLTSNGNINTSNYSNITLSLRLAAFSIGRTNRGVDATDNVIIAISTNGGSSYTNYLIVTGASANNAYWAYGATGLATTTYPTVASFSPGGSGPRTTDGYSTLTITSLPATNTLRVRITMVNNANDERWVVDDFKITGYANSFWYKTDAGTSTTNDNTGISTWADQSGMENNASSQNTAPVFRVSGWNFNPKISFSAGYFLTASNGISDDMTFFAVYNSTQATGSGSFWQTPAIIGGETNGAQNDFTLSTNSGQLYFKGTSGDGFGAQTAGAYNDGKVRIVSVTRRKSASGSIYLYVNGQQAATSASDNNSLSGPTRLGIGNHFGYQANAQFVGDLSEVFGINNIYSVSQRQGFESYLAIKYGISLPGNYFASDGTIIWAPTPGYQNDVHGIGRDDVYGLDQRSSKSENPGTDILTIQSGNSFSVPSNAQSGASLTDRQFLITGHNNGSITTTSALSTGINILARKWYAQVTNSLPTESFQFTLSSATLTNFGAFCKIGILIADNAALTTNQRFVEGTINGTILTVNDASIAGNKYFTVATLTIPVAGAIASNQTICSGDTPSTLTSETTGTGFGTISYQWESSIDGLIWNIISGETNSNYSPGELMQTTSYRRKTVASLGSVSCNSSETTPVTITVKSLPEITTQPVDLSLCENNSGNFSVATSASLPVYQWQYSTSLNPTNWINVPVVAGVIEGTTTNELKILAADITWNNYNVRCVITSNGCSSQSNAALLTVNSPPDIFIVTGGGEFCGSALAIGLSDSETGIDYQLFRNGSTLVGTVAGTGSPISFVPQSGIGTYTVVANNSVTGCLLYMTGNAVVAADTEAPDASCKPGISVSADANSCSATGVSLETPATSDNCGVASITNNAPASYPVGNTIVTWTVTDNAGNTNTCAQTVTVNPNPVDIEVVDLGNSCQSGETGSQTSVAWTINKLSGVGSWIYYYEIKNGSTVVANATRTVTDSNDIVSFTANNITNTNLIYTITISDVSDDCGTPETNSANNSDTVTLFGVPDTGDIHTN